MKPLRSAGYIYPLAKIGKGILAPLNKVIEVESAQAPEPLLGLLREALGGMKSKRRQVLSSASLPTYAIIFKIVINLKQTMCNGKDGIHTERAGGIRVSELQKPTNRPLQAAAKDNGDTSLAKSSEGAIPRVRRIRVRGTLKPNKP
jgi:hypothetical protein